jgi:hypothetical protein
MRFSVHHKTNVKFRFTAAAPGEEATLTWGHRYAFYLPDHRVANVWGFESKELISDEPGKYSVSLPRWPPAAW